MSTGAVAALSLILLLALIFGIQYAANHWDEMFPDQPAVASTDPKGQVDQNIVEGDITLSTKKKIDTKGKPSNCRALPQ